MVKTHWRKNKDPKFLSGEDLKFGLIKDMPDGVIVKIASVRQDEAYQQGEGIVPVSVLMFESINGEPLSKGVIPAKWTLEFMRKLGITSPYLEDWISQKMIIYARPHSKFGYVVRFKEYKDPNFKPKLTHESESWNDIIAWLKDPKHTMKMLLAKYDMSKTDQKKLKEECKTGKK
jgi:hypothetical protein